jgi:hypothetical protein
MTQHNTDEMLRNDIAVLGGGYGTAFYHFRQHLWQVSSQWDRYEALYGSHERVIILNEISGSFWAALQGLLHEHVLLGLCRLTDPATQGKFKNLSVASLLQLDPTEDKEDLKDRVATAVQATAFARTWRDKRIAHNDMGHVTGELNEIEASTGLKVAAAHIAIHDVMRWVLGRYFDGDAHLPTLGDQDANLVMIALAEAAAIKKETRADVEERRYEKLIARRQTYPLSDYGRERRYELQSARPQPAMYSGQLPLKT